MPEIRPIDELFNEDVANSGFYKIVPDDDEEIYLTPIINDFHPIEYKIFNF